MSTVAGTLRINLGFTASDVNAVDPSQSSQVVFGPISSSFIPGSGTGANQCDTSFEDAQSITNTTVNYVLSGLPGGVSFARLRMIYIEVLPGSTGTLSVSPASSHGWPILTWLDAGVGDFLPVTWRNTVGAVVVSGVTDSMTLTAVGLVNYRVVMLGCSV